MKSIFLCTPFKVPFFIKKSLQLLKNGDIKEKVYIDLLNERKWFYGLLAIMILIAPACFILFKYTKI
jgi:hypothetical protein